MLIYILFLQLTIQHMWYRAQILLKVVDETDLCTQIPLAISTMVGL
jgi:hypothetical protein